MPNSHSITSLLLASGARLPQITKELTEQIWSPQRYASMSRSEYLSQGEREVRDLEEAISSGATSIWDELAASATATPSPRKYLGLDTPAPIAQPRAVVVFDGLSLRELPLLLRLAKESGLGVKHQTIATSTLPTMTTSFIEERVIGAKIAPSQLPGRRELREKNAAAFYLDQPNSREIYPAGKNLLIWSSYPDRRYKDDTARFDGLFEEVHDLLPTIWKYTVQAVPAGMPIVVTSDHGYIYFGSRMDSSRDSDASAILKQHRYHTFDAPGETLPAPHPDLQILRDKNTALLRGRIKTKPRGDSGRKLYQHGGLSLMETLVPWIELERPH